MLDPAIVDLDRVAGVDGRAGARRRADRGRRADRRRHAERPRCASGAAAGTFVLRRPPPHKRANSDETMRREARVLGALAGSDVPHPGLIAAEPGLDVIGAAFYLMEPVDGFNATLGLPEPHASDVAVQRDDGPVDGRRHRRRWPGSTSPPSGLADLGRPDGWGERQVPRWRKQLDSYARAARATRARRSRGSTTWPRGSTQHRPDRHPDGPDPRRLPLRQRAHLAAPRAAVAAIVDWELTTIGDPLLDLGHLLASWPRPGGEAITPVAQAHRASRRSTRSSTATPPRSTATCRT